MLPYFLRKSIILILIALHEVVTQIHIVNKSLMALERYSMGLQFHVQVQNEFKDKSCKIMSWCDRCCLTDSEERQCEGARAYGGEMGTLKPREKKILIYVYPTGYLHDLFGFCDIDVYYRCDLNSNGRKTVKLPFDTRIYVRSKRRSSRGIFKNYLTSRSKLTRCSTVDLDPFEKCSPVDCDRKYGGHRPFYDRSKKRCAEAPACVGTATTELPDMAYVPKANTCRDLKQALSPEDIDAISLGLGVVSQSLNTYESSSSTNRIMSFYDRIAHNLKYLKENIFENPYAKTNPRSVSNKVKLFGGIVTFLYYLLLVILISFILIMVINLVFWAGCQCSSDPNKTRTMNKFKQALRKFKRNKRRKDVKDTVIKEVMMRGVPSELRDYALPHISGSTSRYRSDAPKQSSETSSVASVDCDLSECD